MGRRPSTLSRRIETLMIKANSTNRLARSGRRTDQWPPVPVKRMWLGGSRVERFRLGRSGMGALVAMAMLRGCGAGSTGSVPISKAQSLERPAATSANGDLLYVVMTHEQTRLLTYPGDKKVTKLYSWGFSASNPNNGEVLIGGVDGPVYLYAHGATTPLYEFNGPHERTEQHGARDGAFDPTSDDIAVSVINDKNTGVVAVYSGLTASPVAYTVPNIGNPDFVGYDNAGNLFVDANGDPSESCCSLAELPKGAQQFITLHTSQSFHGMGAIQWDGSYITVQSGDSIYRLSITGSTATVVGVTKLERAIKDWLDYWIQ